MRDIITIDPGASGGIAWKHHGAVRVWPMPKGMTAQVDLLREMAESGPDLPLAIVENVGTYMPGNSGPAAATFARHCGHLDATLYCLGIAVYANPTPQTWMKALGHGVTRHLPPGIKVMPEKARAKARADAKRANKQAIKEDMARRYPHLTVTLATADALGLLTWACKQGGVI